MTNLTNIAKSLRIVFVIGCSLAWLLPTYLLIVNAVVPAAEYAGAPHWWPSGFGLLSNAAVAWQEAGIGPGFLNSLGYSTVCAAGAVLVAALAAFALVVIRAPAPTLWFWLLFSGTVFPLQMFLAPLFDLYAGANLYDTRLGLGLIYMAVTVPFAFFVIRNQMAALPRSLAEAAQIDGASWWLIFIRIHLPLMRPALLAAFLFQFTWVWNDMLFGITLARSTTVQPVMSALAGLQASTGLIPQPVILAGALLVSLPTVLLFVSLQSVFTRGIGSSVGTHH